MSNAHPSLLRILGASLPTALLLGALRSMPNTNSPPLDMISAPLIRALLLGSMLDAHFAILSIASAPLISALLDLGPVPTAHSPVERNVVASFGAASLEAGAVLDADCPILGFVGASLMRAYFDSSAVLDAYAAVDYVVCAAGLGADGIIRFSCSFRCGFLIFILMRGGGLFLVRLL